MHPTVQEHVNTLGDRLLDTKAIIQAEIPFTNNTYEPVAFVCWEESIMHNTEQISQAAFGDCCHGDVAPIVGRA